ncbi:MAG: TonB-dependent receptor [Flavobacteriaceae bacterium]
MKHWIILLFGCAIFAQNDSIQQLDEIKLYGNFSKKMTAGYHVVILKKDSLKTTQHTLGNTLQNNANLYFKQNGNGMVSSISMRGSNASHTAVYWNGIAINSTLNGQTDFNSLSAKGHNQIEIRKGAASSVLGSGAIGGAINLRDKIRFNSKKNLELNASLGSYNTLHLFLKSKISTPKLYAKLSVEGNKSNNDFPFLNTSLLNENGAYYNHHINAVFGYRINPKNKLHLYSTSSYNNRNLSRSLTAPSNAKYINSEKRVLLQWLNSGKKYSSNAKFAFLNEDYQYYLNKTNPTHAVGKSNNIILKYDFSYLINRKMHTKIGLENKFLYGNGSNIDHKSQSNIENYVSFHHQPVNKLNYNISLRKGFSNIYKIPLTMAFGMTYQLNPTLNIKSNISTNYKLPTFNDLYWNHSGNENLNSEHNKTAEIGIQFKHNIIDFTTTTYYSKNKDLIQWRPTNSFLWKPVNIQEVSNYGVDLNLALKHKINHHLFEANFQYDYSISKDNHLQKQLIYVPFHKANSNFTYRYKTLIASVNTQYNGFVFTTTSNTQTVNAYWLTHLQFYKKLNTNLNIGFSINNLFNKAYQSVAYRPMPNRNYNLNINLKI